MVDVAGGLRIAPGTVSSRAVPRLFTTVTVTGR